MPAVDQMNHCNHGGSLYNGETQVLYWADASSEIAFVVPTSNLDVEGSPLFDSSLSCPTDVHGKIINAIYLIIDWEILLVLWTFIENWGCYLCGWLFCSTFPEF